MKNKINFILIVLIMLSYFSCESEFDNPVDPKNRDPENAAENVQKANDALEATLYQLINTDFDNINKPSDVDFSEANTLYKLALAQDAINMDANFGAGLTELLMITQDSEINTAFDRWESFLDTASFFEVENSPTYNTLAGFRIGFPTSSAHFIIPKYALHNSAIGMFKAAIGDLPQISELQNLIDTKLLPGLNYALVHLDIVDDSSSYEFTITPKMQGDVDEDSLELDLTEIYAMQVGGNMLKAMCEMMTAYSLNLVSYDSVGIYTALNPGGDFMSLRSNGSEKMGNAKAALLTAIDKLETGINFLKNETDNQNNDIIKIGTDEMDQADLDSILAHIPDAEQMLTSVNTFTEDWDDNDLTPEENLQINLGALFDNPVQDVKTMLPAYSISVGKDTSWDYLGSWNNSISCQATITVPGSDNYYFNKFCDWDKWDGFDQWEDYNIYVGEFANKVDSLKSDFSSQSDISYYNISIYWNSYLDAGSNTINGNIYYNYDKETKSSIYYFPIITWNANSFQEWIFPDPTFNGFLPGMTDSEFKRIFGITEDDWEKTP